MKTALIWPDQHIPHHDIKAYKLMLHVAQSIGIDEIVILGDFADFYSVSSHAKCSSVKQLLLDEVECVNKELDKIDKLFPSARKVFISGNHSHRLARYIQNQAPALFGVTDIRNLFKFDQRPNWKYVAYGPNQKHHVLGSKLIARHEPLGPNSETTARKAMASIVHGHTHRIEMSSSTSLTGEQHISFCPGWLGDKRNETVFGYVKHHANWQLGFGIVHVPDNSTEFYPTIVHIKEDYTCVYGGRGYRIK